MTNDSIEEIWFECMQDSCNPHRYRVGVNGVVKIEKISYSTQPYCGIEYFRVMGEDGIIAELYDVSEVYYAKRSA